MQLAAHGHPRCTGDIDIWINPTSPNVSSLLETLGRFGFGSLGLTAADFMEPQAVTQLGDPPARIDLLTAIDGVEFGECYGRKVSMRVDDVDLCVIHLVDFRANKRAAGRAKDLADLEPLGPSADE